MADNDVQRSCRADEPVMVAWEKYKQTPDFENTLKWAAHSEHAVGSLWAAFERGFAAALEDAAKVADHYMDDDASNPTVKRLAHDIVNEIAAAIRNLKGQADAQG